MADIDSYQLSDRYTANEGTVFMTGIQALARLPIEQLRVDRDHGLTTAAFVSGYPGSPLGGYDQAVGSAAREAPDLPIVHRPAINEEHAATAVMGSQLAASRPDARYDGVLGLWYGKAPGVDRASDAIRHGVFAGADPRGGAVLLTGDDPHAKSSTIPSSSAGSLADMHIPVIYPGNPSEALDLGRHAVAMSRATGLWTSLKIVADVADGSGTVSLDPHRVEPRIPLLDGAAYIHSPDGMLLTPHTIDIEREIYEIRHALAIEYASLNRLNHVTVDAPDAWIGIVSSGITYGEVREAFRRLGLMSDDSIAATGIRLLKLGMPIPFNPQTVRTFARGLEQILVIEEKHPNVESLVKEALYNESHHPLVIGKFDDVEERLFPGHGALTADMIIPVLRRRLHDRLGDSLAPPEPERERIPLAVTRSPFFCSGCPHNRSTIVPDGAVVGAGIGCHTMVVLGAEGRAGDIVGITCMGNEGSQWIGMSPFVETDHLFQNLGDGTYFHSGQLSIPAAVAAGSHVTFKILWNDAVAMTGGQDPTGRSPLRDVVTQLLAQGVRRVIVTTDDVQRTHRERIPVGVDIWPRDRMLEAQEALAGTDGVTVLIHEQRCAAEVRRDRKRGIVETPPTRVAINHRVCEGCGDCARVSNCLSVQPIDTPFGRKTSIDQTSCNLDLSCLEGDCPAFVTVTRRPDRWWRRRRTDDTTYAVAPDGLIDPPDATEHDVSVHITGVGGTGVITVAQIIGTAAMLEGAEVSGLDQIGLSQKAGPVVSDLRITHGVPAESSRVGQGQADLLLAFDLLVAASWTGRAAATSERTGVVGSTTVTPPGAKVARPSLEMPSTDELIERVHAVTRPDAHYWADADEITTALFGDSVNANVFVAGMALQTGLLPVDHELVEHAIGLNGVAVDRNLAALRWGRWWVADRTVVERAVADRTRAAPAAAILPAAFDATITELAMGDGEVERTLSLLTADLIGYQNRRLARDYLDFVGEVEERERLVAPSSRRLTSAVAIGLHKLLAYKDEYEVARLMLDADGNEPVAEVAGPGDKVAWRLHPPVLRALGQSSKISFSTRWRPAFRMLAAGRRLRGHWFDPFAKSEVRRVERRLPGEYREAVRGALGSLTAQSLDQVVELAELPDIVRGFEGVKLANVVEFRRRLEMASSRP